MALSANEEDDKKETNVSSAETRTTEAMSAETFVITAILPGHRDVPGTTNNSRTYVHTHTRTFPEKPDIYCTYSGRGYTLGPRRARMNNAARYAQGETHNK